MIFLDRSLDATEDARTLVRHSGGHMRRHRFVALVIPFALSVAVGIASRANAQASAGAIAKCRATVLKSDGKYVKALTKVLQKCNDAAVKAGHGASAPGGDIVGCD